MLRRWRCSWLCRACAVSIQAGVTGLLAFSLIAGTTDLGHLVQLALQRYGPGGQETVQIWSNIIGQSQTLPEREKLEVVNTFFNRNVMFEDDRIVWKVNDYWATPLELLGRGQGDCEDFTIGKYVTLGILGVPIEKLRLTYVRAELGLAGSGITQAHMVLAYYAAPDAEPLILDNLVGELRPASRRPDLKPVFGFNSQGLWVAGTRAPVAADPTARLSRWRDLLRRMRDDGLN